MSMQPSIVKTTLNPEQLAAVHDVSPRVLLLAGAGSGKTRTLTHRIAYLVQQQKINSLLAVTFTRKASDEMRLRVKALLDDTAASKLDSTIWIGTFHSVCARILRIEARSQTRKFAPSRFTILDSEEQNEIVRQLVETRESELAFDRRNVDLSAQEQRIKQKIFRIKTYISSEKSQGRLPLEYDASRKDNEEVVYFRKYQQICKRMHVLDFDDLILNCVNLLESHLDIRQKYDEQFPHILVDEFQDTSVIQLKWLKLLSGANTKVFVVGDDDQCVYTWRQADADTMSRYLRDTSPPCKLLKLEQNYRSVGNIITASNAVIKTNQHRLQKSLWTKNCEGPKLNVEVLENDEAEALFIASKIETWKAAGKRLCDVAVMYRAHRLCKPVEQALTNRKIPFVLHGNFRLFAKAEVKDLFAYVKLTYNRNDDLSWQRIINKPPRGIGKTTIALLQQGRHEGMSMMEHISKVVLVDRKLGEKRVRLLNEFCLLLKQLREILADSDMTAHQGLLKFYSVSGLEQHYLADANASANICSFFSLAKTYSQLNPQTEVPPAVAFVNECSGGLFGAPANTTSVNLLTLHSAKGLEFRLVFMAGCENGVLPCGRAEDLEEERRLFYVGLTRARSALFLTAVNQRDNNRKPSSLSPFIFEIPRQVLCMSTVSRPKRKRSM